MSDEMREGAQQTAYAPAAGARSSETGADTGGWRVEDDERVAALDAKIAEVKRAHRARLKRLNAERDALVKAVEGEHMRAEPSTRPLGAASTARRGRGASGRARRGRRSHKATAAADAPKGTPRGVPGVAARGGGVSPRERGPDVSEGGAGGPDRRNVYGHHPLYVVRIPSGQRGGLVPPHVLTRARPALGGERARPSWAHAGSSRTGFARARPAHVREEGIRCLSAAASTP